MYPSGQRGLTVNQMALPSLVRIQPLPICEKIMQIVRTTDEIVKKQLTKKCKTMKEAERYQNRLYKKYNLVQLVVFPRFSEEGDYIWVVA